MRTWHGIPFIFPEHTAVFGVYDGEDYEELVATVIVNYLQNPKVHNCVFSCTEEKIILDFIASEEFCHIENDPNYLFVDKTEPYPIYLDLKIVRFN